MRKLLLLITFGSVAFFAQSMESETNFHSKNIEIARDKAKKENKLLLLTFRSSWCSPCDWMYEEAFSSSRNQRILSENFVSIEVDIDNIEGFELKNQYKINKLPTLLVFGNNGRMVGRIEKTLNAVMLEDFLVANTKVQPNKPLVANMSPTSIDFGVTKISENNSKKKKSPSFKLQLGLFSNYENTLRFYQSVSEKIAEPIIILHDFKGSSVVYRVLLGNFESVAAAQKYKLTLNKELGIKSHLYL